ncbi:LOG family protein [Helicobacter cetorum]|uniref:Acyl-CoA synthetase n=1 Tax=Helicobacter cetorum (strain ATCC BAA-429 / MIT 00-7128) TaxID=182217 RepID=I0ENZ3_HELC0|nr:LOG family protein [Helicobacter cetorum]AFI04662.1 acyl-CoA synthetase [Helicobacter cetorum MIT 00-7128]
MKTIAVIGDASLSPNDIKNTIALELGELLIDNGYRVANGGLGGVMESVSKGARNSKHYTKGCVIGVLPNYDTGMQNPYIDVSIPTGLGLSQANVLISLAQAVIIVGGKAGTLAEIAFAWQMQKLMIALDVEGIAQNFLDKPLDSRRKDKIYKAHSVKHALELLNAKIKEYDPYVFKGIEKARMDTQKVQHFLSQHCKLKDLTFLAERPEGFVFRDNQNVYKWLDFYKHSKWQDEFITKNALCYQLCALQESLANLKQEHLPNFNIQKFKDGILLSYPFVESESFEKFTSKTPLKLQAFIDLMLFFKKLQWVLSDLKPSNLRLSHQKVLMVCDIGHSIFPYSKVLFMGMLRRAFVCFVLQDKTLQQDIKPYLSLANNSDDFSLIIKDFNLDSTKIKQDFKIFCESVSL